MSLPKKDQVSFMCSAPLSVTIAGDDVTSYGRPALMIALNVRVVVSASTLDYEGDPRIKDIYTQVYQEIYSAQPSSMKVSVEIPLDAGVRALQSALIVCFVAYLLSQKLEMCIRDSSESDDGKGTVLDYVTHATITYMACRKAIKAGDHVSEDEARKLITKLFKCENPYSCPHGRPTVQLISDKDLRYMFKRS